MKGLKNHIQILSHIHVMGIFLYKNMAVIAVFLWLYWVFLERHGAKKVASLFVNLYALWLLELRFENWSAAIFNMCSDQDITN